MKSILKKLAQGVLLIPVLALGLSVFTPVADSASAAFTQTITDGTNASKGAGTPDNLFADGGVFQTVVNVLLFIIGAIAVIMLIIGGIRYVVSGGDQSAVTGAKNTILYAIVGIVVALLAYAAVKFVTASFTTA